MKFLFVVLITMFVMDPFHTTEAQSAATRTAIDQKWNSVQKWRQNQDIRFKAIEREAARLLNKQDSLSLGCTQSKDKQNTDHQFFHRND